MRKARRLTGEFTNQGKSTDDGDGIIGATAKVVDGPVRTRNVEDFERMGSVVIETC